MEKFIEVYDNILPLELENHIQNLIFKEGIEIFGYTNNIAGEGSTLHMPGFFSSFLEKNTSIKHYFNQFLYSFCIKQNILVKDIYNGRLFLNFPIKESNKFKSIHTDISDIPHWVLIYYINDIDGDTIFYNDNEGELKRVSPKKGRFLFFDGSIKHTGTYPTKGARCIINFNFIGERF